jgi:hypothetical protein
MPTHHTQAVTWFATGCYYLLILNFTTAVTFFERALSLDMRFAPVLIARGLSYSLQVHHLPPSPLFPLPSSVFPLPSSVFPLPSSLRAYAGMA